MATLYITEFEQVAAGTNGLQVQAALQLPLAEQTVAITTSTQSNALNAGTRLVRLHADAVCSVLFGTNPTALTTSMRMAAGQTEYFMVNGKSGLKIAVITNT